MPAGRPTKLNPQLQRKIVRIVAAGNYRDVAAQYAGVPVRTFHRWCQRGKKATAGRYHELWQAILKAERAAEIKQLKRVLDAAAEDPKHAEWWLERKFPKRWGRKDRMELTGKDGGPVRHEHLLTVEQRRSAITSICAAALERAGVGGDRAASGPAAAERN